MGSLNDTVVNGGQPGNGGAEPDFRSEVGLDEATIAPPGDAATEHAMEHEQKQIQSVKLQLAVLVHRLGEPLDTDIYYGNKLIARQGQTTSGNLVMQLRGFDPLHLTFTNEGVRRLKLD